LPFNVVYIRPNGIATISYFNIAALALAGKIYYVDPLLGSDSNDSLTPGNLLRNIYTAIAKSDAVEIVFDSKILDADDACKHCRS
jgi:hypothetical protein